MLAKGIGSRIRALRISHGMTQEELSDALGYSGKSTISQIEIGKAIPHLDKLCLIADLFKVTPIFLIEGTYLKESEFLYLYRNADEPAREIAYQILKSYQKQ